MQTDLIGFILLRLGQRDRESGAAADFAVDGDAAAVALDDAVDDRQPQPTTFTYILGGEERAEDARQNLRRDAGAVVGDANDYLSCVGVSLGIDRDLAAMLVR